MQYMVSKRAIIEQELMQLIRSDCALNSFNVYTGHLAMTGNNLHLDPTVNIEYAHYCGNSYLIATVTDVTNNDLDPVLDNNQKSIPVHLACAGGNYGDPHLSTI